MSRVDGVLDLLKKINEDDSQSVADMPGDKNVDTPPNQPGSPNPDAPPLQALMASMEQDPSVMGQTAGAMADVAERYMDEDDPSYTPATDDDKKAVTEAKGHMRKAAEALKRIKM